MAQVIAELQAVFKGDAGPLKKELTALKGLLSGTKSGLDDAVKSLGGFGGIAAMGAAALVGLGVAVKQVTDENLRYAESVETLTRITGDSAEDMSRLIQVADDLKISEQELTMAMQAAARKGVDTSREAMAKLSDEYNKLNPGVERAKFLMDNFGRSGTSMAAIMEKGGSALERMYAKVEAGFVINQKAIDQAKEYQLAVDNLEDAWNSFIQGALRPVIPKLTELISEQSREYDITMDMIDAKVAEGMSYEDAIDALKAEIKTREAASVTIKKQTEAIEDLSVSQQAYADDIKALNKALDELEVLKLKNLAQAWDDISESMGGAVGKIRNDFLETEGKLLEEQAKVQAEISKLSSVRYLTPEQKEQLEELKGKLTNIGEELQKNFEKKQKEMKLYFLENVKDQLKDMGPEGQRAFDELATNMGLIDEPTKKLIQGVRDIVTEWKNTKDQAGAYDKFLQSMQKYYEIEIRTIFTSEGVDRRPGGAGYTNPNSGSEFTPGSGAGMASGADFDVPPGFPNDSYPLRVQSGEHVTVTPAGSGLGGNMAINLLRKIANKKDIDERRLALLIRDAMLQTRLN